VGKGKEFVDLSLKLPPGIDASFAKANHMVTSEFHWAGM
jgi:hypothetical protein